MPARPQACVTSLDDTNALPAIAHRPKGLLIIPVSLPVSHAVAPPPQARRLYRSAAPATREALIGQLCRSTRSEERRVGKECRHRRATDRRKKTNKKISNRRQLTEKGKTEKKI